MGLSIEGYGIHATNAPSSVGLYGSHGCMRMYPEHAHELFDLVKVGTPVRIIYQRVVLGYDSRTGVVHMAFYPDPYRFGDVTSQHVREQLEEYGLDHAADMDAVERALARPNGVPMPILGSRSTVTVNGRPVPLALGPSPVAGDWLVPAGPLVAALGGRMAAAPDASYVLVERGASRAFFSPGDPDAIVNGQLTALPVAPKLAAGYPLLSVRATAGLLGASVGWDAKRGRVLVWDSAEMGRTPSTGGP
jgi:hypothetical protein